MRSVTRTRSRWPVVCLLLALAAAGLTACTERPDPAAVLRIAIGQPSPLVPTDTADRDGAQVLSALFTPLVEIDEAGRAEPVAAASIEPDPDARVWTVRLREGFTFHDGEPVTADSYLAAWNYGAYQPNHQRNRHLFARIEGYPRLAGDPPDARVLSGLTKVDDLTFTVTLVEPFVDFPAVLSGPAFYPLPAAAFAEPGVLDPDFGSAPVGNGRFRIVERWETGEPVRVEPHPDYPGGPAGPSRLEFVTGDPAAGYAALLAGEVDIATGVPADRLPGIEADLAGRYLQGPAPTFHYLAVPAYLDELADPEVRTAISMALDREQLAQGDHLPAHGFAPPVVPGARADACGPACALDPVAARERYAAAGGPDQLSISYNRDGGHQQWVEAACAHLVAHLAVECTAQAAPDLADLLARVDNKEPVGLVRLGWAMDYPSMESYLAPIFSTTGSANFAGYRNAEFDDLLLAAATAESPGAAVTAYQRAEDLLARDLPVIPVRFGQHTVGYSAAVRGVALTRFGTVDLARLEAVRRSLLAG